MSLKLHFMDSHVQYFPEHLGDYNEEQGERFHQDINLRRTQLVIVTHTPILTENSVQVFQKKAGPRPYSYSSMFKKKFFQNKKNFRESF